MGFNFFLEIVAATIFTLLVTILYMVYRKFKVQETKIIASPPPSSSPSPSPQSSLSRKWDHDVFLSFHGIDVRKAFLSHILKEFKSKAIDPFIDNEMERGVSITPELKRAIKGSKIAIVLLSKNYASSSWCLDELVKIIKCRKKLGQMVITIFYRVEPTDVKKQTGYFGKVFRKTCKGKTLTYVENWRQALTEVATIAGYDATNWDDEAAEIEKIAVDISKMLNHLAPSYYSTPLIGMEAHMEKMQPYLRPDLVEEARMIGIWGPPGIGKSTIARYLFNQLFRDFKLKAIMVKIKENYPRPCLDEGSAQLQLQNQMMSQMINHKDMMITHLGVAKERLKGKKVLLVLDDVDQLAQLVALAQDIRWFGPGSRVIIVTEDIRVLTAHRIDHDHIYKVGFPSTDEAFQMFCMYAFGQNSPYDGFIELAREVTDLSGNLPLGLEVMGSYLLRRPKQEWIEALPMLRSRLDGNIESILKFSYDALCDEYKDLFLHIACYFNCERVEKVVAYLAESFVNVRHMLHVLAEKSLISIDYYGHIIMHNLLAQLGREIVRKQSIREPGKRQFLVEAKDICEVLTDDTTITKNVLGIDYKYSKIGDELYISESAFEEMSHLQFLRFRSIVTDPPYILSLSGGLNGISPKLRLVDWDYSPMTCLPSNVNLKFLVELKMCHSKLAKLWDGTKQLRHLKWMDLSFSKNLKELPNLSTATSLSELYLRGCSSLVELPFSIGNATNLRELHLNCCSSLVGLPSSIGNATNLQKLDLSHCTSLVDLPSSIGNATNLKKLYLQGCSSLLELPSSIGNATNLQKLNLGNCSSLVEIPSTIGNLHKLQKLRLQGCSKLEILPTNINLEQLDILDLTNCLLLQTFPEISTNIKYLNLTKTAIEEVPSSIKSWSRLNGLSMPYSEKFMRIPHALETITELDLTNTEIQELGTWIKGFTRLQRLVLNGMKKLASLPQLPDSLLVVDAENCESLERLDSSSFCNPVHRLNFRKCFKLNQEARDLIIKSSVREFAFLPGPKVPTYFTTRACGSSLTLKLNERSPSPPSTKYRACILLANEGVCDEVGLGCSVMSKYSSCEFYRTSKGSRERTVSEHLCIFDVKTGGVISAELVFEFQVDMYTISEKWEIKECGIVDRNEDGETSDGEEEDIESSDDEVTESSDDEET